MTDAVVQPRMRNNVHSTENVTLLAGKSNSTPISVTKFMTFPNCLQEKFLQVPENSTLILEKLSYGFFFNSFHLHIAVKKLYHKTTIIFLLLVMENPSF